MYEVKYSRDAEKFILKLNPKNKKQIQESVEKLRNQDSSCDIKKLSGRKSNYRLRAGIFRIIYIKHNKLLIIEIIKISKRDKAYK